MKPALPFGSPKSFGAVGGGSSGFADPINGAGYADMTSQPCRYRGSVVVRSLGHSPEDKPVLAYFSNGSGIGR